MHRHKLTLSYDGTAYSGWQVQANALSIQHVMEGALSTILRQPITLVGASRTDAGVHAKGQVAHFSTLFPIDGFRIIGSLNGLLPLDIRALSIEETDLNFHARYSASMKEYHYYLHLDRVASPFHRLYRHHVRHPIDRPLLEEAASYFVGTHDFTSFSNESYKGSCAKNPHRSLFSIRVQEEEGGICVRFRGNGFLYKMVRNIMGTLLAIASHKLPLSELRPIFLAKDRKKAPSTAPACGLFLAHITYPSLSLRAIAGLDELSKS